MRLLSSFSIPRLGSVLVWTVLAGACAAPIDTAPQSSGLDDEDLAGFAGLGTSGASNASAGSVGHVGGSTSAGGAPSTSAGSMGFAGAQAGSGGTLGSAGSTSAGGAGKGGTGSAGAGKGGTSSGGTGSGGAGKAGATGSAGSTSAAGATGSAGSTSSTPCDAAHSKATLTHNTLYTGKANDCVHLSVNPNWAQVTVSFTPQPGTVYPVPFAYTSSCAGNGTGTLTANTDAIIKSGANPGCDYFVQFKGGSTTVKVIYYD